MNFKKQFYVFVLAAFCLTGLFGQTVEQNQTDAERITNMPMWYAVDNDCTQTSAHLFFDLKFGDTLITHTYKGLPNLIAELTIPDSTDWEDSTCFKVNLYQGFGASKELTKTLKWHRPGADSTCGSQINIDTTGLWWCHFWDSTETDPRPFYLELCTKPGHKIDDSVRVSNIILGGYKN